MPHIVALALLATSCASRTVPAIVFRPLPPCERARDGLQWYGPEAARDRERLTLGCERVGPPVVLSRGSAPRPSSEPGSLTVISWNMHEGRGDLAALVDAVAARATPMIVLAQEATPDLAQVAEQRGWSVAYVPSMPNGRGQPPGRADRGCAILSTLPLSDPVAIELPWVRQRRVAVMATIDVSDQPSKLLRVISVHLENRPGRVGQAIALAPVVREAASHGPVIVGGDLNTWFGAHEDTVRAIDDVAARVPQCGTSPTFRLRRRLDYFFTTLPLSRLACKVVRETYGSDHHPLVLRVPR